jgi:hypothetical protein
MDLVILGALGVVAIGLGYLVSRVERVLERPLMSSCGASCKAECHAQACQSEPCHAQACQATPCKSVDYGPVLKELAEKVAARTAEEKRAREVRQAAREARRGQASVRARLAARGQ